jgi:uncharacterized protein YacL
VHRARPPTGATRGDPKHAPIRGTLSPVSDSPRVNPDLHPLETAERERSRLLRIVRVAFIVLIGTVTVLAILPIEAKAGEPTVDVLGVPLKITWPLVLLASATVAALVVIIDLFTTRKKISTLVSVFFGLLAAMLATYAIGAALDLLATIWDLNATPGLIATIKILIGIALAYLCITTVLQTQDNFRLVIPYVEFAKQIRGTRPLLLDSSALIDARIVDLGQTGLIQSPVIIPAFVVAELQLLADSTDKLRRAKGRRGLEVIGRLQHLPAMDTSIDETPVPGKAVDQMLIELARSMPAYIVTADVGLARVAAIQGVKTLNLNEVANALKPSLVPGEQLAVRLLKLGEQPGQAVGYLDDGTMVVAEDGAPRVGQQVTLSVTSTLQTSAGRLIFGRIVAEGSLPPVAVNDAQASVPETSGDASAVRAVESPSSPPVAAGESGELARGPFPPNPPRRPNPARNPRR